MGVSLGLVRKTFVGCLDFFFFRKFEAKKFPEKKVEKLTLDTGNT